MTRREEEMVQITLEGEIKISGPLDPEHWPACPTIQCENAELANEIARRWNTWLALLEALETVLPIAEAYLRKAPTHPDNGKLADARDAIAAARGDNK